MSTIDESADIVAIRALVDRYSDAANRLDVKGMAEVYTEDGEVVAFGNSFSGRAKIQEVFDQTIGLMEVMNQICSGAVIELDGDKAKARWTVTEYAKRKGKDELDLFLGNYDDEMVRTSEGWKFKRRILSRRMQGRFQGQLRL